MHPTDEAQLLVREGVIDAEQRSRYYGYLSHRFLRLGDALGMVSVCGSLRALFTIVSPLPKWVPLTTLGIVIATVLVSAVMRFEKKAAFSADLYRQMQRFTSDWSALCFDMGQRKDEELREAWRSLSRRQQSALLSSPVELPQSHRLMLLCRREAGGYRSPQPGVESNEPSTG